MPTITCNCTCSMYARLVKHILLAVAGFLQPLQLLHGLMLLLALLGVLHSNRLTTLHGPDTRLAAPLLGRFDLLWCCWLGLLGSCMCHRLRGEF